MTEERPTLVVHLTAGGEPLLFELPTEDRARVEKGLHLMLEHGSVESLRTKANSTVTINFAHVAAAYVEDLQRRGKVFGLH